MALNQYTESSAGSLTEQNIRFNNAMFRAREGGHEKFTVGVVSAPGTERPVFTPHRGLLTGRSIASPAAQCAESGTNEAFTALR